MQKRGLAACLFVTMWFAPALTQSVYAKAKSPLQPKTMSVDEIEMAVQEGIKAFKAQRFEKALHFFERALGHLDGSLHQLIAFNRASCLFQLERYAHAENAFGRLAQIPGRMSVLAALNAGFSAVEQSELDRALAWLERARKDRTALPERFELLMGQAQSLAGRQRDDLVAQAQRALEARQVKHAQELIRQALDIGFGLTASERIQLESMLSSGGKTVKSSSEPQVQKSKPLASFWMGVSGGYDSNVGRASTHAGDISFVGAGSGSPVTIATVELDAHLLRASGWWVSTGYLYDLYGVLDPDLNALSDHYHELEVMLGKRLSEDLHLRARVYGGVSAAGLGDASIYQAHASGQLRLRYFHSPIWMSELDSLGGYFFGMNDNDYLSGVHARLDFGQHLVLSQFRFHAEARLRFRDGGYTEFELLPGDLLACDTRCFGGAFRVTYAHLQPDFGLSMQYRGWSRLRPSLLMRMGYRHYLDDHFALDRVRAIINESTKTRVDWLVNAAVGLEWRMTNRWSTTLQYGWVLNRSNVDSTGDLDDHGWDYANKSFTQHTLELGIEYTYD